MKVREFVAGFGNHGAAIYVKDVSRASDRRCSPLISALARMPAFGSRPRPPVPPRSHLAPHLGPCTRASSSFPPLSTISPWLTTIRSKSHESTSFMLDATAPSS